ncbi:MAG: acyl-ACP--UDP-N-acetylglucosamine O-acyltransferase [Planctomycetota bacterium]|nr:acyl-ACP--UDP-N-acetylglucosamine O-acyltransferase [Planctomycetota bacterium]
MNSNIHKTAIVHPNATIGENVTVGPYCIIEEGATVGDGCRLYARSYVCTGTILGKQVEVHMNAVVGHLPQDLSFDPSVRSGVQVGRGTVIREGCTIHRATKEGADTILGENIYMMANAHVAHDCRIGDNTVIANGALIAGHCEVGEKVFISGNSPVHQFVRIGRLAMIGGLSRVNSDCPPFMLLELDSTIRRPNIIGLRRAGMDSDAIDAIKRAYHILYREGMPFTDAYERIRKKLTTLVRMR